MAKTFTAPFAQTPRTWNAVASGAIALTGTNSLADNTPANTVLIGTAGPEGAMLTQLDFRPRATNTATAVFIFFRKPEDALNIRRFIRAVVLPATTISATGSVTPTDSALASEAIPYRLEEGDELYFGLGVAQAGGVVAHANAMDF